MTTEHDDVRELEADNSLRYAREYDEGFRHQQSALVYATLQVAQNIHELTLAVKELVTKMEEKS